MTALPARLGLLMSRGMLGYPEPAPRHLMVAVESVEVNQSDGSAWGTGGGFGQGFQITFRAERTSEFRDDFDIVTDPHLKPGSRVIVTVGVGARSEVLIDGIISHHQLQAASDSSDATFTVTGEDISAIMDLVEIAVGYPALNEVGIVAFILAKYAAAGILPTIIPPPSALQPLPTERVPYQRATDRDYLRELATQHSFVFGILPGPLPMMSRAYFGPRIKVGLPQKALSVDQGPETNVASISFSNDASSPEQVFGLQHRSKGRLPIPFATVIGTSIPYAARPSMLFNQPYVKKRLADEQRPSFASTFARAQSRTTRSSEDCVNANGSLDVLRYRSVLKAPGIVGVRGAGRSYDGFYYVKSVKHRVERAGYTQDFVLTREGVGTLFDRVLV